MEGQNNFSALQQMNQKKSLSLRKEEALDASTQIEKGELFDFDVEVEQMQDFERVRNRELEIVQKLELQTKSYLKNLRTNALNTLTQNVLKKPELNEYNTKLTPIIKNKTEKVLKEEQLVNEDIEVLLQDTFTISQKNNHKTSVQNEYKRKANIRQQKINELLQEREAKKKEE